MMELTLQIRYVEDQGWVAWVMHEGEPAWEWTPIEEFHRTPAEAAQAVLEGLPALVEQLQEVFDADA